MDADWRARAACRGRDASLFFPVGDPRSGATRNLVRAAQEICAGCQVRLDCLEFASVTGQKGVWGGLTEQQRSGSRLCRSMRAAALGC